MSLDIALSTQQSLLLISSPPPQFSMCVWLLLPFLLAFWGYIKASLFLAITAAWGSSYC